MGSGKTTVGRRLALRLGWAFVDADEEIEAAAGMSIREIFEKYGEPHFRDGERRVIARLMDGGARVIATGGGAFVDPDTRAAILQRGTAIWLDACIETLAARVSKRTTRPLLTGRDPATVLEALAKVRNPLYAEAHLHVLSRNGPHSDSVEAIVQALSEVAP
jgi:shikimate kinase